MIVATHHVAWTMGLLDFLQSRQRARGGSMPRAEPDGLAAPLAGAGHPSVDLGIGASSVDELLASESEFLQRFKYCYGCDGETFSRDIVEPIRRYASYVNLLPATADNFFCTAGGLFRLGLEVAFFALQGTDAHIVSGRATSYDNHRMLSRRRVVLVHQSLPCSTGRADCHRPVALLVGAPGSGSR